MSEARIIRSIREQVVDRLRADVLSGRIAEGEPLREVHLAERFGTSRGPIRDALLQLTQEGLFVSQPSRGARVGSPPDEAIRPLLVRFRREIEAYALGRIFDGLGAGDLAELDAILGRFREACARGDMPALIAHDMSFHRWIVERVGDPNLTAIWLTITVRMRLRYTRHKDLWECYREHEAVVEAIRRRDAPAAIQGLEANIQ